MLATAIALAGCNGLLLSPRAEAAKNMEQAICEARSINAAAPHITSSSRPLLELMMAGVGLAQVLGKNVMADFIAKRCHQWSFKLVEEIKVSEDRYIIRAGEAKGDPREYVVVRENGDWKVALFGD